MLGHVTASEEPVALHKAKHNFQCNLVCALCSANSYVINTLLFSGLDRHARHGQNYCTVVLYMVHMVTMVVVHTSFLTINEHDSL